MTPAPLFADVIVPLAIPRLLTYRIPDEWANEVGKGHRVLVNLAGKHYYTGIVRRLHHESPEAYEALPIHSLLDPAPLVTGQQLKFWDWMAGYYMCTGGEVMATALPGALLLSSETILVPAGDYREYADRLTEREFMVAQALELRGRLTLAEIAEMLQIKTVQPIVKSLLDKGLAVTEEELHERYVPRTETTVRLQAEYTEETQLNELLNVLERKAPKQAETLLVFLSIVKKGMSVTKSDLKKSGASLSALSALVEKGILGLETIQVDRLTPDPDSGGKIVTLSPDQSVAFGEIKAAFEMGKTCLLQGVTGSGKTEVYISLIKEAVDRGEQVLFLQPEIALTAQMIQRLRAVFGEEIGLYHSKFNQNERVEIWHKVAEGGRRFSIILGARSAIFLPFVKLGLIIVDEEHDPSYKQYDPSPRYQGRDAAIVLAKMHGAKVLLGSATPSLETSYNAHEGRFSRVKLAARHSGVELPEIHLCDLRSELKMKTMKGIFSGMLFNAMSEALSAGEKIILFQNRRGYNALWQCHLCGWTPECTRCDVSLTYHKQPHELRCHYCGHAEVPPGQCKACGSTDLRMIGFGTEKVEEELRACFPEARFLRMDLDTVRAKHGHRDIIERFAEGETDVLIGTQMVSKGLDFDNVGLVGILNADLMFKFPDFRAHERAFQLMVQVAGRAGRKHKRGKVVAQTYDPNFWLMHKIKEHDYEGFYTQELKEREIHGYPPFFRIIKVGIKHRDQVKCDEASAALAQLLRADFGSRILGPEYHYVARIRNQYIKFILIKIERKADPDTVKKKLRELQIRFAQTPGYRSVKLAIDIDPS